MGMHELADARGRLQVLLYGVLMLVVVFYAVFALYFPIAALPPRVTWLPAALGLIVSPFPFMLDYFAAVYPWHVFGAVFLITAIRRAMLVLRNAQDKLAQGWHGTGPIGGIGFLPRFVGRAAPPRWLTGVFVLAVLTYAGGDLIGVNARETHRSGGSEGVTAQIPGCEFVHGMCRLARGESVLLTVRADTAQNRTGVLLEASPDISCEVHR